MPTEAWIVLGVIVLAAMLYFGHKESRKDCAHCQHPANYHVFMGSGGAKNVCICGCRSYRPRG